MKKIDENYFINTEEKNSGSIEANLTEDEQILWKGKPRKGSYILSAVVKMMPFALLWLCFDGAFIGFLVGFRIWDSVPIGIVLFLIFFFAFHLAPVWIWIANILKANRSYKNVAYAFTNQRIIIKTGAIATTITSIYYSELVGVTLHIGIIERLFKVGDVYISSTNQSIVLEDIEDCQFVSNQLQKIAHDIKTDILFPNDYRPSTNHGYQTEYKADRNIFLKRRKK